MARPVAAAPVAAAGAPEVVARLAPGGVAGGTGAGRTKGKDKRRKAEEHELFDDGQDWLDDDGAYDGLID